MNGPIFKSQGFFQHLVWVGIAAFFVVSRCGGGVQAERLFHRGRYRGGNVQLWSETPGNHLPPEQWFTQQLDHFNPTNQQTWKQVRFFWFLCMLCKGIPIYLFFIFDMHFHFLQQRYFTNNTFYKTGGPVFLMIGGEGEASAKWMVEGQWIEDAQVFHALCFQLEHRYYGKSHPTK